MPVPHEGVLVARRTQAVRPKTVVRLVFRHCLHVHLSLWKQRGIFHYQHSCKRIRAIHQRCRALHYLYRMDAVRVDFYSVLIAPLLPFLTYSVVHNEHTVVAETANDGLGDAASGAHLRHSRLLGDGVYDVC